MSEADGGVVAGASYECTMADLVGIFHGVTLPAV